MGRAPPTSPYALRQLLDYNPETGNLTWKERPSSMFSTGVKNSYAWNIGHAGKPALNSVASKGYLKGQILGRQVKTHRVIWALVTGAWPTYEIDHINGVRDDNRWANLREVTTETNARNKVMSPRNTSGHNGVSWDKLHSKWRVHIGVGKRKTRYIGIYTDKEKAIAARKEAERAYGYTERHGTCINAE